MINIFLSHSSIDQNNYVTFVAKQLKSKPNHYNLLYYNYRASNSKEPMDEIINNLWKIDLFVIFISTHSLRSPNVKRELGKAVELHSNGYIKNICPVLIDHNVNIISDNRIPTCIKALIELKLILDPYKAVQLIEEKSTEISFNLS